MQLQAHRIWFTYYWHSFLSVQPDTATRNYLSTNKHRPVFIPRLIHSTTTLFLPAANNSARSVVGAWDVSASSQVPRLKLRCGFVSNCSRYFADISYIHRFTLRGSAMGQTPPVVSAPIFIFFAACGGNFCAGWDMSPCRNSTDIWNASMERK